MAEYIKREDAGKAANEWVSEACKESVMRVSRLFDKLKQVPAADVAPVVHGRWIYDEKAQRPYCSVCKGYFYGATNSPMNYCPNCGAKMDGGVDDG